MTIGGSCIGYRGGMRISTISGGRWDSFSGVTDDTSSTECGFESSVIVLSERMIGTSRAIILDLSSCSVGST